VASVSFGLPEVSFLWHNVIGAVTVVVVGVAVSAAGTGVNGAGNVKGER
jgi:hypothetical protein